MWFLILVAFISLLVYLSIFKVNTYWTRKCVPQLTPLPLIGNMGSIILRKKEVSHITQDIYNSFPNSRYYGIIQFGNPLLYVRDLDLIKRITVKDFDQFSDHNSFIAENVDPLMRKNLFSLGGQEWRDMRATLSPSFTTSKIKTLFELLNDCAREFVAYFERAQEDLIQVEMKDISTRFTNDAIASVVFGFKCDSLKDRNNEFYSMGVMTEDNSGGLRFLLMGIFALFPFLQKLSKVDMIPGTVSKFFRRVVKETIYKREVEGFVRHDMINLLLEARKGVTAVEESDLAAPSEFSAVEESKSHHGKPKLELTDEDITAQAFIFFVGGFETTSSAMTFMSYELATNPDVQEKLQAEVDETLSECEGKLSYHALQRMKYLDMVVSETLRKWPPGYQLDRRCVKDYVVQPEKVHEKTFTIERGSKVIIPVMGIHYDPQYFPNPDRFDPERFSDENKVKIHPYSYLPFGSGPRNCIGARLVPFQTKLVLFHLLGKYRLVPTEKTVIPFELHKASFSQFSANGYWLGLEPRKDAPKL
ncbi:hypothetical protein PPYR_13875 [Photinus pyralis]|uniref:Cytochrome P450 n=1 Tax=Photinus pyralis TaxID=7054 RepID=A0A5N4AAA4_PHOPY|nr:hypothetical protein PPYR_13875 [Photinus pyralis]